MIYLAIKKVLSLITVLSFLCTVTYGQKTEISLNAYTAFFNFRGDGTALVSHIYSDQGATPVDSTFNVYGRKSGFSYSMEMQVQRVTKSKFIYGLGAAFEQLNSKVSIDSVFLITYGKEYPLSGKTLLKNSFITINPFLGRRFTCNSITIDLIGGLDAAFFVKSQELAKVYLGKDYTTFQKLKAKPSLDYRSRVQIKAQYKNAGLLLGYSIGLTNYIQQSNRKVYSNLLRLGVSYKLR